MDTLDNKDISVDKYKKIIKVKVNSNQMPYKQSNFIFSKKSQLKNFQNLKINYINNENKNNDKNIKNTSINNNNKNKYLTTSNIKANNTKKALNSKFKKYNSNIVKNNETNDTSKELNNRYKKIKSDIIEMSNFNKLKQNQIVHKYNQINNSKEFNNSKKLQFFSPVNPRNKNYIDLNNFYNNNITYNSIFSYKNK